MPTTFSLPANLSNRLRDRIIADVNAGNLPDFCVEENGVLHCTISFDDICDLYDTYQCDDCDNLFLDGSQNYVLGDDRCVCNRCREEYYACDDCGYVQRYDDTVTANGNRYCSDDCADNSEDEDEPEYWSSNVSYVATNTNKNIKKRYFGVEVETSHFGDCGSNSKYLGDYFNGVEDGSISGVEIVSVKLMGDNGLKIIHNAMKEAVERHYAKVDKCCGLHIHIDIRDFSVEQIKTLHDFCVNNYDAFKFVVPKSRVDNSYCKRLEKYTNMLSAKTTHDAVLELTHPNYWFNSASDKKSTIESFKSNKYVIDRYVWANFGSYGQKGTIEIRLHSGTIDATKITNWAKLWVGIVDDIKNGKLTSAPNKSVSEIAMKLSYTAKQKKQLAAYYEKRKQQFCTGLEDGKYVSANETAWNVIGETIGVNVTTDMLRTAMDTIRATDETPMTITGGRF